MTTPDPLGRKSLMKNENKGINNHDRITKNFEFYLPTMFSITDDFPDDWDPTTVICGKSIFC